VRERKQGGGRGQLAHRGFLVKTVRLGLDKRKFGRRSRNMRSKKHHRVLLEVDLKIDGADDGKQSRPGGLRDGSPPFLRSQTALEPTLRDFQYGVDLLQPL
jgi:hypothetical protein